MKNHEFQELVDQNLSGLVWDENKRQRTLGIISKGEKSVKKISKTFVLAAAILCLTVSALAAGVVFSNRVDMIRLAEDELTQEYGITAEMLGYFTREIVDGQTVSYVGVKPFSYVLGSYTVTVKDGKADASWSWDEEPILDGFDGRAWGAKQLEEMCLVCRNSIKAIDYYLQKAEVATAKSGVNIAEDGASAVFNQTVAIDLEEKERVNAEKAKSFAKLSVPEMETIAREAIALRYDFTSEQAERLTNLEENGWYCLIGEDETPCYQFYFFLGFEDGYIGPGKGIYHAAINVQDGAVEDIIYDSDLAGQG